MNRLVSSFLAATESAAPGVAVVVWSLYVFCSAIALIVTALKGRWSWLLAGVLTAGVAAFAGATRPAAAGSIWDRRVPTRN